MTEVQHQISRNGSRQSSPVPRHQLGLLSSTQRSYSRMSSKGMIGDDSPLMSPLPYYPRRRSVTFAGENATREERPHYNATYSSSAPVSPVRQRSPPPVSILKSHPAHYVEEEDNGAMPNTQAAATATHSTRGQKVSTRTSPVPARGRSSSRQRIAARRREAQLHHSFYDDSFVEEFVLSAKSQFEEEENKRRIDEKMKMEQEKARKAELRATEAAEKISALQHAKDVLLAAANRRRASVTPSPTRNAASTNRTASSKGEESSLLKQLEEDADPEVQAALDQLSRLSSKRRSRVQSSGRQRRRSVPLVSENALIDLDDEEDSEPRKRARLERIVDNLMSERGKSKSKRSVLVINWSDVDSDAGSIGDDDDDVALEMPSKSRENSNKRGRAAPTKSRSVGLASEATLIGNKGGRKPASRQGTTSRRRNVSAAPDLGDSLLFDDDEVQPILLPRRQHKKPAQTRSISHIEVEPEDDFLLNGEDIARRPPQRNRGRAPKRAVPTPRAEPVREASVEETPAPAPRRRRGPAPRADPSDPMAIFFDAAFPSPSKFDEMMLQAGGLPENRRGGGGRGNQNNLVLPSQIGRRR